ncbi:MAG TPA: hypothetical protein VKE96_15560 [Vicinamibacterales bacterium]|nr:hypothetical protein [Vicinamibacterales bacterium]
MSSEIYLSGSILGMRRREIAGALERIIEFAGVADASFAAELAGTNVGQLSLVHPSCCVSRVWDEGDLAGRRLPQIPAALPGLSRRAMRRRLPRLTAKNGSRVPIDQ